MSSVSVVVAVEADLDRLKKRDKDLAASGLAASALVLAHILDDGSNSATSRSMCAKTLLDTLDRLWEIAPEAVEEDDLDKLRARRAARRGAA